MLSPRAFEHRLQRADPTCAPTAFVDWRQACIAARRHVAQRAGSSTRVGLGLCQCVRPN